MHEYSRRDLLVAAGATVAVAGCTESPLGSDTGDQGSGGDRSSGDTEGAPVEEPYVEVYEETVGSVVQVRMFGGAGDGEGSGFVYDDGHLVTNQHVVAGADGVEVGFDGGRWREASIEGTDVYSDLAVLEVDDLPAGVEALSLAASDPPAGTQVLALGNPLGFEASASAGIVSALERSLPGPEGFSIPAAIQTDAGLNPGNSGGPLVTLDGAVVGINTYAPAEGLGFAVSAPLARQVVPDLVETGSYTHSYVGVQLLTVEPVVAEANDLDVADARGVLVVEVLDGEPADGILEGSPESERVRGEDVPVGGDVIQGVDGVATPTLDSFSAHMALETSPGDIVEMEVRRNGEQQTVEIELGERPQPG